MDNVRTPTPPEAHREELLERYHALLKEKKELRRRNNQAQTNICNYLRKHNIDLFPPIKDKNQVHNSHDNISKNNFSNIVTKYDCGAIYQF